MTLYTLFHSHPTQILICAVHLNRSTGQDYTSSSSGREELAWHVSTTDVMFWHQVKSIDTHLLFQFSQLAWQVRDELHGGIKFLLKIPDLVLFALGIAANQRHGPHAWKPVQVVVLLEY